jgi:hypothetical protein
MISFLSRLCKKLASKYLLTLLLNGPEQLVRRIVFGWYIQECCARENKPSRDKLNKLSPFNSLQEQPTKGVTGYLLRKWRDWWPRFGGAPLPPGASSPCHVVVVPSWRVGVVRVVWLCRSKRRHPPPRRTPPRWPDLVVAGSTSRPAAARSIAAGGA